MSNYPKIYSLSTVGIRQHNNYNYLFHDIRTDFTGRNGTGKSIIADIMQLIFIPYSDMWKSGTEGLSKKDRQVWGMPLPKNYINFAYAFLNIEKSKGNFITIGVYIPKSHQPVRPFIISKLTDSQAKNILPFKYTLKSEDFLAESKAVLSINDLKQRFLLNDLLFQDYFQKDNVIQYFDILYKSQLCPVDLSKENNLKAYAKVIQSFSRAKSLDINNSKSLKDFLFEDDDEIKQTFVEQKEQLENYIKQYRKDSEAIIDLEKKQKRLIELKVNFELYKDKRDEYYSKSATNSFNKYGEAKKAYFSNKELNEKTKLNLDKNKEKEETQLRSILSHYIYLKKSSQFLWNKYKEEKPKYSEEVINSKQEEVAKLGFLLGTINEVKKVYERFDCSLKKIETKFTEQTIIKEKRDKLNILKNINSFEDFKSSLYADNFSNAQKSYQERIIKIDEEIKNLSDLLNLYDINNPNSLFQWAIQQKSPFSLAQETIIMHLKDIATKRGKEDGIKRYTDEPLKLLNSYSETKEGIWLHLGYLSEFVNYIDNPKFSNKENMNLVLENDRTEIKDRATKLQIERKIIMSISNDLVDIGYNDNYCNIWKDKESVENYSFDDDLTFALIENLKKVSESINEYDSLKIKHEKLQKEITDFAREDEKLNNKIKLYNGHIDEYNEKIAQYQKLIDAPVEEVTFSNEINIIEIEKKYNEIRTELNSDLTTLETIKKNISTNNSTITGCKEKEPLLKKDLDALEKDFNKRKIEFEEQTNISFESILPVGGLTDEIIEQLKVEFEKSKESYYTFFINVQESFEESKNGKNEELKVNEYNFDTLVKVLCGKFKLDNLAPELTRLNEELANFGKLQLYIIFNVFSKVEKNYRRLKSLVVHLNDFFKKNKISLHYTFRVDFKEATEISIEWIDKMRNSAKTQAYGKNLFSEIEEYEDLSPEQLIISIAQKFSKVKNCELSDLLNPKYYFELKVGLYDDENNSNSGSGGQAYTALALLCIGRMSVIQQEVRPGVRFIIIEELSNIDDTNFNTFPEIARQFGYQLLTMTPKPFGSYSDDEWFLHMLSKGTDKNINYTPMSFFKTKNSKEELSEYMKRNELENITNTI